MGGYIFLHAYITRVSNIFAIDHLTRMMSYH
jgi:hypothetical protein